MMAWINVGLEGVHGLGCIKVAVGYALPCRPNARWHGGEIQASNARLGVDEIVVGFDDMEIDIP